MIRHKQKKSSGISTRTKTIILVILALIAIGIAVYFSFFYSPSCQNFACFKTAMENCEKKTYLNEEPEASWLYSILGSSGNECNVEVKLLQAKTGELGIDKIAGYSMVCSYPLGTAAYPEKDLSKCNGRLKEELQGIIIKKLHSYIIENLGQVDQALNKAI